MWLLMKVPIAVNFNQSTDNYRISVLARTRIRPGDDVNLATSPVETYYLIIISIKIHRMPV